jgi:hypothetical protein
VGEQLSRLIQTLVFAQRSAKFFDEGSGACRIGKAPSKINFALSNNSPSMPRLNFSRPVKGQNAAAHFDIQFIISYDKLNDVGIFTLVCDGPAGGWLAHNSPPDDQDNAMRLLADKHRQVIPASSRAEQLGFAVPCPK